MIDRLLAATISSAAIVFVPVTSSEGAETATINDACHVGEPLVTPLPPERGRAVVVSVSPTNGLVTGRPVEWQFTVANRGARPARLVFHSAMFGDVTLHAAGRQAALDLFFRDGPVYRWSADRGFAQPFIGAVIPGQSAWRCRLAPSTLNVVPGRHLLVAYLNAGLDSAPGSTHFRQYVDVAPAP
jgi:hypothetical protein